jgi:hypothetical protein
MFVPLRVAEFRSALMVATRDAYEELREHFAKEQMYGFSLCITALAQGVGAAYGQSEEGLDRVVEDYLRRGCTVQSGDLRQTLRAGTRWYSCDGWKYANEEHFSAADKLLSESFGSDCEAFYENGTTRLVFGTCYTVLQELDTHVLFGKGSARQKMTVNLYIGDHSDQDLLRWADELNPFEVFERYKEELAAELEASKRLIYVSKMRS